MKTKNKNQKALLNLSHNNCNRVNQERQQKAFISKTETASSMRIFYVVSNSKEFYSNDLE